MMKKWIFLWLSISFCVQLWAQNETFVHLQKSDRIMQYANKGDSYLKAFNIYAALTWYKKAFAATQEPIFARKIAQCYLKRGQYTECKRVFDMIPTDSLTHLDLRFKYNLYNQSSEVNSMLLLGKNIIQKYPFDSEIVASLASTYNTKEQPDSALFYTENYVLTDSTNLFINGQRAFSYYLKKEYRNALKIYSKLLLKNRKSSLTHYYAGLCYTQCDSLNKAYYCLSKAHELDQTKNPYILSKLGIVSMELGLLDEGIELTKKGIELLKPSDAYLFQLNNALSNGYYSLQDYATCIKYLKRCLNNNPSSVYSIYKIARAYNMIKNTNQEKLYYERFVKAIEKKKNPSAVLLKFAKEAKSRLQEIKEENFFKKENK